MKAENALKLIFAVVDDVNRHLPEDQRVAKDADAPLVGDNGRLDSLALINFVVAVEQKIAQECGAPFSLTDPGVMERWNEIFRTLGTLSEYLGGQL